ncbi:MAG: AAA family ATPase [Anaerolineae bacterium]|nr:AAA family ATPase [Anaerolineae bacterium]
MTLTLLRTKLLPPPSPPSVIQRERLLDQLDRGLAQGRKLTLVSAQAGAGKTTLLAGWLHRRLKQRALAVGWLGLDPADNDPTRFLSYLLAAFQEAAPALDDSLQSTMRSPQPPPAEVLLTALINQLSELATPLVIFLDDYHLIETLAIHQALTFLLDHQPANLHLVLATRADPALPLARLRTRDQLNELRISDLRFSTEEAARFLNNGMNLQLTSNDIQTLESRTEGWVAGLQLAGLSLRGRDLAATTAFIAAFGGTHHFVLDYLAEEVFQQQTEQVQSFLLQTAILERLCGPLCDAVTRPGSGLLDSQSMLERLVEENLFLLPLDEERRWFRYHRLFADLLRQRLARSSPELVNTLHRRAAGWLSTNGYPGEAFEHWLAADAGEEAAQLAEELGFEMLEQGQLTLLLSWLTRLPEQAVQSRPWLCVYYAWALLLSGQPMAVETHLQAAEQHNEAVGWADPSLRGNIDAIRSYMLALQGAIPEAIGFARSALVTLPEDAASVRSIVAFTLGGINFLSGNVLDAEQAFAEAAAMGRRSGNLHVAAPALRSLGNLLVTQGKLHQAAATYREALRLAETAQGRTLPVAAGSLLGLGELAYEWNDLTAAEEHSRVGIELSRQWGNYDTMAHGLLSLAHVEQARGDPAAARRLLDEASQLAQEHTLDVTFEPRLVAMRVRLDLEAGEAAAALSELRRRGLRSDSALSLPREAELLVLVQAMLAGGQVNKAKGLLARLIDAAGNSGRHGDEARLLAFSALAWQTQGDGRQALANLVRALRLAQPGDMVRSFVDLGGLLADLLRQIPAHSDVAGYASRLLNAFPAPFPVPSVASLSPNQSLVEPLSDRELEVLALLARGFSNRQIADKLIISVGTVKAHTSNIYGKLGVRSRAQAVIAARDLGLLESLRDGSQ